MRNSYKKFAIADVIAAVKLMEGDEHTWGSTFKAKFDLGDGLTAQVEGRLLVKEADGFYYYNGAKDATHVNFQTWTMSNVHFFGKGARSERAWEFADRFFGLFANLDRHDIV